MASLTDERLKEMEEEMNRFEEEILTSQQIDDADANKSAGSKVIIGSNTFNEVQAQLSGHPPRGSSQDAEVTTSNQKSDNLVSKPKFTFSGTVAPPPPPPPEQEQIGPRLPDNVTIPVRPPPPPPPPGFIPPQLRHRPPMGHLPPRPLPPQPPRLPPGGPRGMMPPPQLPSRILGPSPMPPAAFPRPPAPPSMNMPPVHHMPPAAPPPPPPFSFSQSHTSAISSVTQSKTSYEQPKVVYAAPPMINKPVSESQKTTSVSAIVTSNTAAIKPSEKAVTITTSAISVPASGPVIASGIELNIPVEKIEAEKKSTGPVSHPANRAPAAESKEPSSSQSNAKKDKKEKKRKFVRMAAGTVWEDQTLGEWDLDDFRLFCGDLGNEVTDDTLGRAFNKYPSFQKAKVIRDKRTNKTKGFGFVSFKDPNDFTRAMREMNGKYVGNRPIKLRKSQWRDRQIDNVKKKEREKKRLGFR